MTLVVLLSKDISRCCGSSDFFFFFCKNQIIFLFGEHILPYLICLSLENLFYESEHREVSLQALLSLSK